MAVNNNADDYANARLNHFFPASSNNTNADGDLTGQCVTEDKWFLDEMCSVPNPFTARGDAKDFGDTLVSQGLATKVASPIRGDIAVWKVDGGGYGHTGVVLSGNRVFESNVGLVGTPSKLIQSGGESWYVYASRIDPLEANWRVGPATFYRVKSYKEVTPKTAAKPAAKAAPSTGRIAKKGTATVAVATLNVRESPSTSAKVIATYSKGQKFNYDSYQITNGYVWLSYVSYGGARRYIAEGPNDGNPNTVYVSGGVG